MSSGDADLRRSKSGFGIAPIALLILGLCAYLLRATDLFRAVPGDLGDARFNSVILEHLFQWVHGDVRSLWSPSFFYPAQGALAFSDNHFGSGVVYVLARFAGLGREQAFNAWLSVGFLLDFCAMYLVMRRWRFEALPASVAAFLFTFALPALAQEGHAQLVYRFAIPLAYAAFLDCLQSRRWTSLGRCVAWGTLQLLCSIYLGVFLAYLLVATVLALCLPSLRSMRTPTAMAAESARQRTIGRLLMAACAVVAAALLLKYHSVSRVYGFTRDFAETRSMLPTVRSYLLADGVLGYRQVSALVPAFPMRHEHQLFPGVFAVLLALCACFVASATRSEARGKLLRLCLVSLLLLALLTISVDGHSLYRLVMALPGLSSIRAVSRVVLVMMLPVAVIAAIGVEALQRTRIPRSALAVVLAAALTLEVAGYQTAHASIEQWKARQSDLEARLPVRTLDADAVLYATGRTAEANHLIELDGMILGQDLMRPTLNGYSGNAPPGYVPASPCTTAAVRIYGVALPIYERAGVTREALLSRIRSVALEPCSRRYPSNGAASSAPEASQSSRIELTPEIDSLDKNAVQVHLSIRNNSDAVLHSLSSAGHPLRISWRFVTPGPTADQASLPWIGRVEGNFSIPPGGVENVPLSIQVPAAPGSYLLQFSLVAENEVWLHDRGMPIASIPVRVD